MRAFLAVFAFAVPVCGRLPDIQVRLLSRESREGEPDSSVGGSIAQVRWSVNRTRRCEFVDVFWHMEGESPSTLVAESCASNIPNTGEYELQLPKVSLSGPYVLRLQCHSPFWKRRNRISINGFFYSTLEDHEIFHRGDHCQRSNRSIPSGWQVSPDDGRVHETVVGAYPWSTHILVLSSGKGYAVKHGVRIQDKAYKAGQEISLTELGKTAHDVWGYFDMSTNSYKSLQCASLLSIRTKEPAVSLHWPKSSSVNIYSPQCQTQAYDARSDCGFSGITPAECRQRGCCFDRRSASAPQCYHLRREPSLPELLGRISMTTEQEEGKLSAPPNVPKRLKEGDIVLGVLSETVKDPSGNYLHGAALTGKVAWKWADVKDCVVNLAARRHCRCKPKCPCFVEACQVGMCFESKVTSVKGGKVEASWNIENLANVFHGKTVEIVPMGSWPKDQLQWFSSTQFRWDCVLGTASLALMGSLATSQVMSIAVAVACFINLLIRARCVAFKMQCRWRDVFPVPLR